MKTVMLIALLAAKQRAASAEILAAGLGGALAARSDELVGWLVGQ